MRISRSLLAALTIYSGSLTAVYGQEKKIVSWNAEAALLEGIVQRRSDFKALVDDLKPDVIVLLEVAGLAEAQEIAKSLGWNKYHGFVTNWNVAEQNLFFSLEAAVISKDPIEKVIEYDASPDGAHPVFTEQGFVTDIVSEEQLTSSGISGINPLGAGDRGTVRVDLGNQLSIFPVHLKANPSEKCGDLGTAITTLEEMRIPVPELAQTMYRDGFPGATKDHKNNAIKRERVIGAVVNVAEVAVRAGRSVIIAGDFNTSFEPGKAGHEFKDCILQNFSCKPAAFPEDSCRDGDGFDDTLAILENGLVGDSKWAILSKDLPRTYFERSNPPVFADLAIDHMAVPRQSQNKFAPAKRASKEPVNFKIYGSDHYPISTVYRP